MATTTLSKLRANLKSYCDKAATSRRPIRVRRQNGKDIVLLAADEYESMAETVYLFSSPRNAARLLEALASAREGKTKPMTVEELRAAIGL